MTTFLAERLLDFFDNDPLAFVLACRAEDYGLTLDTTIDCREYEVYLYSGGTGIIRLIRFRSSSGRYTTLPRRCSHFYYPTPSDQLSSLFRLLENDDAV